MEKIIIIILIHTAGDHIFQWLNISVKKQSDKSYLLLHTFIYSIFLTIGSFAFLELQKVAYALLFITINSFSHFLIDLLTGNVKRKLWKTRKESAYNAVIALDQIAHLLILFASYHYISQQSLL